MKPTRRPRVAFTIVEMLVVVGVLTVLIGLLLPALGGAQRRAKKAEETNRIRQVGIAFDLYATSNTDRALPGYITPEVQQAWRVRYKFPATLDSQPTPGFVNEADAAPWTWRLLPYLSFDQETVLGHLTSLEDTSKLAMSDYDLEDEQFYPAPSRGPIARPSHIAWEPTFGYNALYVGGWWEETDVEGDLIPRARFSYVSPLDQFGQPMLDVKTNLVANSPSSIRDPSRMILFCTSAMRTTGEYHETRDDWRGAHLVVPPIVGAVDMWRRSTSNSSDTVVDVVGTLPGESWSPIPAGRYTGQASVLHADLHTQPQAPGNLDDQRFWINGADGKVFRHEWP